MPLAAADTGPADLTMAFVLLLVMIAVSFVAGYGVAFIRLSKRRPEDGSG